MILLDTGPSERGWHRLEAWMRCPRLYALGYGRTDLPSEVKAARFPPALPLVRGTIGHVGLAHLYARLQASQRGEDPEAIYPPREAMHIVADRYDIGPELYPQVRDLLIAYVARYPNDKDFPVVGVETPLECEFYGYRYTARADLIAEDRAGKVWITDHKIVGKIESKTVKRYESSGQFMGLAWLGHRAYGDRFGGVQVNLLAMRGGFHRAPIYPKSKLLETFPETVQRVEEEIAEFERTGVARASPSEFTCWTSYGPCPAMDLCEFDQINATPPSSFAVITSNS